MLVVGPKESQSDTVNVRIRGIEQTRPLKTDEFIAIAGRKIADKQIELAL
jgi:threonyl-tRNA synthetase